MRSPNITRLHKTLIWPLVALPLAALAVAGAIHYWPHDPPPPLLPAPRQPLLPDLTMPALSEFYGAVGAESKVPRIFFTASIANVGRGPFIIQAVRGDTHSPWRVSQRFRDRDGSITEQITQGEMVWGGHGHNHWHVHLGASYLLYRVGEATPVKAYEKVGYCFVDRQPFKLSLPTAARARVFPTGACDGKNRLALDMGISSGWSDPYQWTLPDQRIVIAGLANGRYRLVATADPDNWFRESNERNNFTWVDLQVTTSVSPPRVEVLKVGPHA
jgi:hypothetical protein